MCVKTIDRCLICDCFFNDPEVPRSYEMIGWGGTLVCGDCYGFTPNGIIEIAIGAINEVSIRGVCFDKENWHTHSYISLRRDQVFQARKFKVGDFVKVTSQEDTHAKGWDNSWEFQMNAAVGKIGIITNINCLDISVKVDHFIFDYPWWVLKKVDNAQVASVVKNDCPRCQSSMNKQTSYDFSGRPFDVMKCRACGHCE